MKKHVLMIFGMAALLLGSGQAEAQKQAEKDAAYQETKRLIESGSYVYQVQSVNPASGRTIRPSTIYTMVAEEGRFRADLPYFGRAYQGSYGGDGGVVFEGEPEELEISGNEKKRQVMVKFSIRGESNDRYSIIFTVGHSGYGTLRITRQRRQPISYYGLVSAPAEK